MTEPLTTIGDAWVSSGRTGMNTGSGRWLQVQSGSRRAFLNPSITSMVRGRTVLSAVLTGHVGPGHVAQTYTVAPVTSGWSPGRVTWANQPSVDTARQITKAVSAQADGTTVEFDLTAMVQAVAAGTAWQGVRITTNSATTTTFYATDSGRAAWELLIELSDAPEQPSNLRPDGGAVSSSKPILAWDFADFGGESTEQGELRVRLYADETTATASFDSGWVLSGAQQYDLAASTYDGLLATPFWTVAVRDTAGVESVESDRASFTTTAKPTVVIDSPVGAFGDPSPQLLAHLSTGTVAQWRAWVYGPDRADERAQSEIQTSATIDWAIPDKKGGRRVLVEDEAGWIKLRVWDSVDRTEAVGDTTYIDTWIQATWGTDAALSAVTNLSVTQLDAGDPRHLWSWSRTEAAEAWLIQAKRGDAFVTLERLEPADVTVSAGVYSWTDSGQIPPARRQELRVLAVEGNKASDGASVFRRHVVSDLWLIPDEGAPLRLKGTASPGGFTRADRIATYTPVAGSDIDIIYDFEGMRGQFVGGLDADYGEDELWAAVDRVNELAKSRVRTARMVWGSKSIVVRLRHLFETPHATFDEHKLRHGVSFEFVEVG